MPYDYLEIILLLAHTHNNTATGINLGINEKSKVSSEKKHWTNWCI